MKNILTLCFLIVVNIAFCQHTYSKLIDLDEDARRNGFIDMLLIENDTLIVLSAQFCKKEYYHLECAVLSKLSSDGNLHGITVNDSVASINIGRNLLNFHENEIYLSTNNLFKWESELIYKYDRSLKNLSINSFPRQITNSQVSHTGMTILDDNFYLFGKVHTHDIDSIQIIKLDSNLNELWRKYYTNNRRKISVRDMQHTPDGNIAFAVRYNPRGVGPSTLQDSVKYMKIDTSGTVLDSFAYETRDPGNRRSRLLVTKDGDYIFHSQEHPILALANPATGRGLISKLNRDMKTIEWTTVLPRDHRTNVRSYFFNNFIETANGDIVMSGAVWDATDATESGNDRHHSQGGVIVRLRPDGEIVWFHIYLPANDFAFPIEEYGRFRPAALNKIKELPDGRFIAVGEVAANLSQEGFAEAAGLEFNHLWLLMVDENGCLEDYPCQEVIRLDSMTQVSPPAFPIGSTWYYEYNPPSDNPNEKIYSYIRYEVSDTLRINGELAYRITNNRDLPDLFIRQNENRVWFWHEEREVWQLTYNFLAMRRYEMQFGTDEYREVSIDTIIPWAFQFGVLGPGYLQHISVLTVQDTISQKQIIRDCGPNRGGLTHENHPHIGKIRCFEQGDFHYNFGPFWPSMACDSVRIELIMSTVDYDTQGIFIYPNPVDTHLNIGPDDIDVHHITIYNVQGVRMMDLPVEGRAIDVSQLPSGVYFAQIRNDNYYFQTIKFIKS
jgi:hypothetical protein